MSQTSKATLQLALKDEIQAYALEGVIYVINELYTHYCWLQRAEEHQGPEPYDDTAFALEDFLLAKRAEIGSPNFLDLNGWIEPLRQTLVYIGVALPAGALMLKNTSEAWKNWIETKKAGGAHKQAMEEQALLKARLENEKLAEELAQLKENRQHVENPAEIAQRLYRLGKVSGTALEYKRREQNRIDDKIGNWHVFEQIVIGMQLIPESN